MKDPTVRLVLDTTAVLAYAAGGAGAVHVGETIAEVAEESGRIGVPAVCLAEATRRAPAEHAAGVALLVAHPGCVVLPTLAEDWQALSGWTCVLGRVDLAVALLDAIDRPATYVATGEPGAYGDDELPIISI